MKISSIDFLTQIDVLTNNVQNMVTSRKYTKLVQPCINPNAQRCFPLPTKFNFDFICYRALTQLLYYRILQKNWLFR